MLGVVGTLSHLTLSAITDQTSGTMLSESAATRAPAPWGESRKCGYGNSITSTLAGSEQQPRGSVLYPAPVPEEP
jgi:hypothetical protein